MTETYCQITHEMMRATHWVSKTTGEHLKLSPAQKIIWVHMNNRYNFFRSLGKEWFDSQEDIAFATGCDVSTVKLFIKQLVEHGYMKVERKKIRGFVHSNSYNIVASLQLHNKHVPVSAPLQPSSEVVGSGSALTALADGGAVIASQEVVEQPVPFFEDIPIGVYADMPLEAPVVVHETSRGFADTLDAVAQYKVPRLTKGLATSSSETDLWG